MRGCRLLPLCGPFTSLYHAARAPRVQPLGAWGLAPADPLRGWSQSPETDAELGKESTHGATWASRHGTRREGQGWGRTAPGDEDTGSWGRSTASPGPRDEPLAYSVSLPGAGHGGAQQVTNSRTKLTHSSTFARRHSRCSEPAERTRRAELWAPAHPRRRPGRPGPKGRPNQTHPWGLEPQQTACRWDLPSRQPPRPPAQSFKPSSLFQKPPSLATKCGPLSCLL